MSVDEIVALLDDQAGAEPVQQGQTLTLNWLSRRTLFEFDSVKIIQATDEDVGRFAVQVGNDTDPLRQPRYKQIQCTIAPGCQLSANTRRILERTFGSIEAG